MRLEEMQMLRFGQVIDLDELDRARENRTPRPRPTTTATVDDEVFLLHTLIRHHLYQMGS